MSDTTNGTSWGTDTPISMPEPLPPGRVAHVDMGGFCFTIRGIAHNLTEADREVYTVPTFMPDPYGLAGEVPQ